MAKIKHELGFLEKYDRYLSGVRHEYYRTGSVAQAAPEVLENKVGDNRFEKLFMAVAIPVLCNGDSTKSGSSSFLAAVLRIRQEIAGQRRFINLSSHKFTGLAVTAVWPLWTVPMIAYWAGGVVSALGPFYSGQWGYLIMYCLACICVVCFEAIDRLRTPFCIERREFLRGKKKSVIIGSVAMLLMVFLTVERHIEAHAVGADCETIVFDVLTCILCAVIVPALFGLLQKIGIRKEKQLRREELKRFRYVIEMMRDIDGMGPVDVLESIEFFSQKYLEPVSECLNTYATGADTALETLKKAMNGELSELGEALIASEELGVEDAFDEITSEIEMIREEEENTDRIELEGDVLSSEVLAAAPGILILFGYLIIPFLVKALSMFNTYQETLRGIIDMT